MIYFTGVVLMGIMSIVYVTWQALSTDGYEFIDHPHHVFGALVLSLLSWIGIATVGIIYLTRLVYNRYKRNNNEH